MLLGECIAPAVGGPFKTLSVSTVGQGEWKDVKCDRTVFFLAHNIFLFPPPDPRAMAMVLHAMQVGPSLTEEKIYCDFKLFVKKKNRKRVRVYQGNSVVLKVSLSSLLSKFIESVDILCRGFGRSIAK